MEEKLDVRKEIISWIISIAVVIAVVFVINNFVIVNAVIPSGSMENTIDTGDRIFALRLTYDFSDPERGDIVIFKYPVDEALGIDTNYIKRIIGLPGETVEIRNGKVYIDGSDTPLEEDYLKEEWVTDNDGLTYTVPEGCYFMMGDNRNHSLDSRYWANEAVKEGLAADTDEGQSYTFVKRDEILGKAVLRYWPLNEISLLN